MVESQGARFNLLPARQAPDKFSALGMRVHDALGTGASATVDQRAFECDQHPHIVAATGLAFKSLGTVHR